MDYTPESFAKEWLPNSEWKYSERTGYIISRGDVNLTLWKESELPFPFGQVYTVFNVSMNKYLKSMKNFPNVVSTLDIRNFNASFAGFPKLVGFLCYSSPDLDMFYEYRYTLFSEIQNFNNVDSISERHRKIQIEPIINTGRINGKIPPAEVLPKMKMLKDLYERGLEKKKEEDWYAKMYERNK